MSTTLDLLREADLLIASCDGLAPEEMDATIALWMEGATNKAAALQAVVSRAESQEAYLTTEAKSLTAAAIQQAHVANRCRGLIVSLLRKQADLGEGSVIRGPGWSLSLRTTEAVEVSNPALLPPAFVRSKVSAEPDKAAIKAAIDGGQFVPGATVVQRYSTTIRKS